MRAADDLLRGAVAGAAAGLIAAFVSSRFQAVWNAAQERLTGHKAEGDETQDDPPPLQAADAASELLVGTPVPEPHREPAGALVHYLTGAALGGIYGLIAEPAPAVTAGWGTAYGAATAAILDEALVPALGLAPPPTRTPAVKHAYGLATHLVFGLALESSRRVIRWGLDRG